MAKRASKKAPADETGLLAALRFIQVAQQEAGVPYQTHCRFMPLGEARPYVVGFDGVLAAGHPVQEQLNVCPHTYRLIDALNRIGASALTVLDNKQILVKAERFQARVSAVGDGDLTFSYPDAPQWPLNDAWKHAASLAGTFNTDSGQTVMHSAIVTRDGSVIGTNGTVVVEAWHGIPTPPGLVVPMPFIHAIEKVNIPIARFGYKEGDSASLTVHFENGAWIKTQLYSSKYPNVDMILAYTEAARPISKPKDFEEAIKAVLPFGEGPVVYVNDNSLQSHADIEAGAKYELKASYGQCGFNGKHFLAISDRIEKIDFTGNERVIVFFGDKMRGAFAKHVFQ